MNEIQDKIIKKNEEQFLTFHIGKETFALPALEVRDVMYTPPLAPVPLGGDEVAGLMNMRGHIVTAIHGALFFRTASHENIQKNMCIVLQHDHDEMYSFIVDKVFDIENLPMDRLEDLPSNLVQTWSIFAKGIFRLEERVLIVLSKEKILHQLLGAA